MHSLLRTFVSPNCVQISLLHPAISQEAETFVALAGAVELVLLAKVIVAFVAGVVVVAFINGVVVVVVVVVLSVVRLTAGTGTIASGVVIVVFAAGREPFEIIVVLLPGRIVTLLTPAVNS